VLNLVEPSLPLRALLSCTAVSAFAFQHRQIGSLLEAPLAWPTTWLVDWFPSLFDIVDVSPYEWSTATGDGDG
jgi:hypothetical protein